jgi:pimeloyl-ACP methyl ester carboxylesterase
VKVHPALKILFSSPRLAGLLPIRGTRRLAEAALPFAARHVPWLLTIYMNPRTSDVSVASELVKTVEDPNRFINREIALWIAERDLVVRGQNVAERLRQLNMPLLCISAVHDGIVPRATAEFPYYQIGSAEKQLLPVGDATLAMAHADMFIANAAHERVFTPIADFLSRQYQREAAATG